MAPHTEEYQMTYPEDPRSTLADLLTFYVFLALLEEVRRADRLTEHAVDTDHMRAEYRAAFPEVTGVQGLAARLAERRRAAADETLRGLKAGALFFGNNPAFPGRG